MRSLKILILIQLILIIFINVNPAHAIIIVAPVAIGLANLIILILSFASLPVTLVAALLNIKRYKESKLKFFLLTIVTWLIILSFIGGITYLLMKVF